MLPAIGGQKGYSLIEIIIVIVVLGIIGGVTFQIVASGVEAFKESSARKELYDQGRLALERMAREIRDAKELVACSDESITFNKQHPSQDGVAEIKFWLDGTNLWRVRNPSTTADSDLLASNVDSFQVANENCGSPSGISIDNASSGTTSSDTANSMTVSHTTGSGSNRLMLVGISYNNDDYETVTGVTYNGTSLVEVGHRRNSDDAMVYIYASISPSDGSLVAPDSGTHNVVINFSTTLTQGAIAGVVTFTGVNETTPLGSFVSAEDDDSTPATVDIPSDSGELVYGVASAEYEHFTAASSGQNEHWRRSISGEDTNGAGGTDAGASPTVTMSWSLDPSYNHWAIGGVSIKPSSGGGSAPAGSVVSLELTLSSEQGGTVSMRTKVNMRNVP